MFKKVKIYISDEHDIRTNLALEEYLIKELENECAILFLWWNNNTIVIGRNQNPWRECHLSAMEEDNINIGRRKSGGGAVFQDPGNVNYSFICYEKDYNIEQLINIVTSSLKKFGIDAFFNGRNDLLVEGNKKVSGSAFSKYDNFHIMHATMLINADLQKMAKYLNVSKAKLASKGVKSVQSRVTNLVELNKDITVKGFEDAMIETTKELFGDDSKLYPVPDKSLWKNELDFFTSDKWVFGRKINFEHILENRFDWGEIQLHFQIKEGLISECKIYTDSMDETIFDTINKLLINCKYSTEGIKKALDSITVENNLQKQIISDIITLLKREL
ncbi:lipoate-protein ligase A [Acetitomaculum ruminis DSM 5522]|uniref:lipoate--protein ligase n=1 Tax=Acetitomaculum ruminis DSM 5522 TaxID=1120918 RepID=A0A1I0X0V7_9FIRM|nr:lipoate--protein ligase [Acetitomaculum ruminis]SFA94267.1 lipoate-protein ligase A [Acetitomaculum ruminis DSM 5522]